MTGPLSDEWFVKVSAALAAAAAAVKPEQIGDPAAHYEIEMVITGGEPAKRPVRWRIANGQLVELRPATEDDEPAVVSVPQTQDEFVALASGGLDPAVAFMRGDLKPEGSAAAILAFMSAFNRPEVGPALASVA